MKHALWAVAGFVALWASPAARAQDHDEMERLKKEFEAKRAQMQERFENAMRDLKQGFEKRMGELKKHGEEFRKHGEEFKHPDPKDLVQHLLQRLEKLEHKFDELRKELQNRHGEGGPDFFKMVPKDFDLKKLEEFGKRFGGREEFRRFFDRRGGDDDDDDDGKFKFRIEKLFKEKGGDKGCEKGDKKCEGKCDKKGCKPEGCDKPDCCKKKGGDRKCDKDDKECPLKKVFKKHHGDDDDDDDRRDF